MADLVLELSAGGFGRLREATAVNIEEPAVIVATQPVRLDDPIAHVRPPVRAVAIDESEIAGAISVQDQILPEQSHRRRSRTRT
jgi:hypothetical protein